jgi:hypothetical protein
MQRSPNDEGGHLAVAVCDTIPSSWKIRNLFSSRAAHHQSLTRRQAQLIVAGLFLLQDKKRSELVRGTGNDNTGIADKL